MSQFFDVFFSFKKLADEILIFLCIESSFFLNVILTFLCIRGARLDVFECEKVSIDPV